MHAAPAALLGRGFLFGLLIVVGFSTGGSHEALCTTTDCSPCTERFCYDPAAARPLKERKKAAAIASGLPERLAKVFDEIADCVGCVEISPDWPHIVIEYDVEAMERKYGPGHRWTSISRPWTADEELRARNDMREGLVKSIHITLARYPCRCCPRVADERQDFIERGPDSESYWSEQDGWNETLNIHEGAVVWEANGPQDLGPDPEDLTNIPESAKRPPVDLEICGGPEVPPARYVHVSCEACRPIKEEHDQYANWIHDAQIRLRALKRSRCVLIQVINGIWGEIQATEQLAQTPQTQAKLETLLEELAVRHGDLERDEQKMKDLEAEIRDLEAKRQAAIARLIACEEQCRQAAQPQEQVAVGDEPIDGGQEPPGNEITDDLNPAAIRSTPLLLLFQDGGLEFLAGSTSLGPSAGGHMVRAAEARAGRGADDQGSFLDGPMIYIESLGGSTGEVFKVHIVNPDPEPLAIEGYAAIEPVQISPSQRENLIEQIRRAPGAHQEMTANFYCLEFLRQAPSAGTVYRIADAAKQEQFAPAARALEAARRLRDQGLLNPDTNPESYFHSIRQWAVWTLEQEFDREEFLDAFVEHTRKNFARIGQPWSGAVEATVRQHAEGRWQDITEVLAEAR